MKAFTLGLALTAGFSCCPPAPKVASLSENAPIGVPHAIASNNEFVSLEGPFWVTSWGYLVFSDVVEQNGEAAKIYRFDPRTGEFSMAPYPGMPITTNGLAVDANGQFVACERWNGVLARVAGTQRSVIADRSPDGQTLNAPNDVAIRADGNIYFTDTTWGARPGTHAPTAVYRVSPNGALSLALQVDMPNGVALSPDGKTLYVGSDVQNRLWRMPLASDGSAGAPEPFGNLEQTPQAKLHVPDGLCIDDLGRVYVTNNSADVSAIVIFDKDGHYSGRIPFPAPPSNCSFGGPDRRTMYVTTLHALYEVRMDVGGLP